MKFFEQQRILRKNTIYLIFLFALAVFIIATLTGLIGTLFVAFSSGSPKMLFHPYQWPVSFQNTFWDGFIYVSALILLATLSKIIFPSTGENIALSLGGNLVDPESLEKSENQLINVVEEMAIASGVKIPKVFILERDQSINAFAAGKNSYDAVIAVTRGLVDSLTREELQAVIGHEFSHILNEDMPLNLRISGAIFGMVILSNTGRAMMEFGNSHQNSSNSYRRRNRKDSSGLFFIGLGIFIIGTLGVILSRMIQAAISRQREFLADASAVQFTRNPQALVKALLKIKNHQGSEMSSFRNFEYDHFFFASGVKGAFFNSLFATHPEISQRIAAIDPHFKTTDSHLGFTQKVIDQIPTQFKEGLKNENFSAAILFSSLFVFQKEDHINEFSQNNFNLNTEAFKQIKIYLQNTPNAHTTLLSLALNRLAHLSFESKGKILENMKQLFIHDNDFSLLEMLTLFYSAKILFTPKESKKLQDKDRKNKTISTSSKQIEKMLAWFIFSPHHFKILALTQKNTLYSNLISSLVVNPTAPQRIAPLQFEEFKSVIQDLDQLNIRDKEKFTKVLFKTIDPSQKHSRGFDNVETQSLRMLCGILEIPVAILF